MNSLFEKYPWLKTVGIVALIIIGAYIIYSIGHYIWYWNFDTTNRPGEVESLSWKMEVYEYHWESVSKNSWEEDVPYDAYFIYCEDKERTVSGETVVGQYCSYYVDEWVYKQTIRNSGTDKNPAYPSHPSNTLETEYREQPGTFTVTFSSVEYVHEQFSFNYNRQTWDNFRPGMRVTVGVNKKGKVPFRPELPR